MTWTAALVEPPSAICTAAALRNAPRVRIRCGVRSSRIICTIRSPQAAAIRGCAESTAGMLVLPGSASPSASTIDVIVLAVPIVLQVPGERVIRASSSRHSSSGRRPAWYSPQNISVCVPAPTIRPR